MGIASGLDMEVVIGGEGEVRGKNRLGYAQAYQKGTTLGISLERYTVQ